MSGAVGDTVSSLISGLQATIGNPSATEAHKKAAKSHLDRLGIKPGAKLPTSLVDANILGQHDPTSGVINADIGGGLGQGLTGIAGGLTKGVTDMGGNLTKGVADTAGGVAQGATDMGKDIAKGVSEGMSSADKEDVDSGILQDYVATLKDTTSSRNAKKHASKVLTENGVDVNSIL